MNSSRARIFGALSAILLFGPFLWDGVSNASARTQVLAPASHAGLDAFQLVSPDQGWILYQNRLYWSENAGDDWLEITPGDASDSVIASVYFVDAARGWAILVREIDSLPVYLLAQTHDRGADWQVRRLELFEPGEVDAFAGAIYMDWVDLQTGWLVIKRATGSNFSHGTLFKTTDSGESWTRLSLPLGEPVDFTSRQIGWVSGGPRGDQSYVTRDGGLTWQAEHAQRANAATNAELSARGIVDLDLLVSGHGWASQVEGKCQPRSKEAHSAGQGKEVLCQYETRLLRTADGGRTWETLTLPGPGAATTGEDAGEAAANGLLAAASSTLEPGTKRGVLLGQGFDACEIPTLGQLQNWWTNSPYAAVNLYIGGSSRACSNTALTGSYLSQLSQQGWTFIPTWVGPQAPCTIFKSRIDPENAYEQGVQEANAAVSVAAGLGLTNQDESGTVIYYDMESFNVEDSACVEAVKSFISGWTTQMQAKGNLAGVYGSPCTSALNDFLTLPQVPDAVWLANWIYPAYTSQASVWNVYCMSNAVWPDHQRLRQYTWPHDERWGSLTLEIDSDVLDGPVAILPVEPVAKKVRDNSYLVQYDGWEGLLDPAVYGGGYRATSTAGQSLTCTSGILSEEVTILTYKGSDQGQAQIFVDGVLKKTVDLYRATEGRIPVIISNLPNAKHTVVITALGTKNVASSGTEIRINGCRFGTTWVDDSSYNFRRYGSWAARVDAHMDGKWHRVSYKAGAEAKFTVYGTSFTWLTAVGPAYGKAQLIVDGVPLETANLYDPVWAARNWQVNGLTESPHTVVIRVLRQKDAQSSNYGVVFDGFVDP